MSRRQDVNEELAALADASDGLLKREQVVEAARNKKSALYAEFKAKGLWDDAKAAEMARLEYAGRLIRTYVVKAIEEDLPPVRAMVSVVSDRERGGGYRPIRDVLDDDNLRAQMIATALMELRALKRKYDQLTELAAVWAAIPDPAPAQAQTEERASA